MDESELNLDSILQLLDEAGLIWLTDEIRQLRYGRNEPSISSEWVARSRRTYNASRGETPFEPIETPLSDGVGDRVAARECISFIADRIESMANQLEQAKRCAAELEISRIQFGIGPERESEDEAAIQLLRALSNSIRAARRQ